MAYCCLQGHVHWALSSGLHASLLCAFCLLVRYSSLHACSRLDYSPCQLLVWLFCVLWAVCFAWDGDFPFPNTCVCFKVLFFKILSILEPFLLICAITSLCLYDSIYCTMLKLFVHIFVSPSFHISVYIYISSVSLYSIERYPGT